MIRKLDLYVARELFVPFVVGAGSVVLMFIANTLLRFSQELSGKDLKLTAIAQLILFSIPGTLKLTLPVAATLSAAVAASRLTRESETSAMRAAGIPLRRIFAPIAAFGLLVSAFAFYLSEMVVPKSEIRFSDTLRKMFASGEGIGLRSNVLLKFDNGRYYVNIANVAPSENGAIAMSDVDVFYKPKLGEIWHYHADNGTYQDGVLTLLKPTIRQFDHDQAVIYTVRDKLQITQRMSLDTFFGQPPAKEQTAAELKATIADLRERGLVQTAQEYEIEYQNRFSIPASCLVFTLIAPVVAFHFARGGAFVGALISIVIVFLYYNAWIITSQVLAPAGILTPLVGAWMPNLLFAAAGLFALVKSE